MKTDIQFLKDLQAELNNQSNDCQASPRFWAVGDYKWVECANDPERHSVYLPNDGECYEINYFLEEILDREQLTEEQLEELKEISCEESAFDWIEEHYDDGATLIPQKKEHFIRENTMFLTKLEAQDHIKFNDYHYTKEVHTYAMTAWRAPKVERLLKVLSEFDFDRFCIEDAPETTASPSETAADKDFQEVTP